MFPSLPKPVDPNIGVPFRAGVSQGIEAMNQAMGYLKAHAPSREDVTNLGELGVKIYDSINCPGRLTDPESCHRSEVIFDI